MEDTTNPFPTKDLNKYTHFNTTSNPNPITKHYENIGNMGKFNVVWINL
jgi:hypothetical protein